MPSRVSGFVHASSPPVQREEGAGAEGAGAGVAAHLSLQLVTFRHLDGEGSPYFLRGWHPRAWGAARSSNLMSLKKVR